METSTTTNWLEVIVIESSDDDGPDLSQNQRNEEETCLKNALNSRATGTITKQQNECLELYILILPHLSGDQARANLIDADWNVERAVNNTLCSISSSTKEQRTEVRQKSPCSFMHQHSTIQGSTGTKECLTAAAKSHNGEAKLASAHHKSPTTKRALTFKEIAAEPNNRVTHSEQPMSEQWRVCIQRTKVSGEPHFIDADFPPAPQSLDGRERLNSNSTNCGRAPLVKCRCGVPAAAKQVQADGPNYGRFYLACGQQNRRRANVVVVRRDQNNDDATRKKKHVNEIVKETTEELPLDEEEKALSATQLILIHNPYAKKQKTLSTPTKMDRSVASTTAAVAASPPTPSTPLRENCNFFQWDVGGALGAATSATTSSGYGNPIRIFSWFRFGLEHNCVLYKKYIDTSQIRQGAVGNCWFLSALAVVAEKPYLIQKVVPHDTLNEMGCYQVNLFLDGQWRPVIVDSYLPVVLDPVNRVKGKKSTFDGTRLRGGIPVQVKRTLRCTGSPGGSNSTSCIALPAFCAAPDRQLWAPMVEKAYAKAHGSYQQLSGGFIAEGLQDLTGAPIETVVFQAGLFDRDAFWIKLLSFHTAGFLMGVATARGGDGLVGEHAYSVLDVLEVTDSIIGEQSKVTDYFRCSKSPDVIVVEQSQPKNASAENHHPQSEQAIHQTMKHGTERTTIRLVRIRNPWGKREWQGDWSADSERWTQKLRKRLGSATFAKGDGTFYMSFEDMLQRFHHMDVAKTQEVRTESNACIVRILSRNVCFSRYFYVQGWVHNSVEGLVISGCDPLASSQFVYSLTVSQTTQAFVTVIQPKKRSNTKSLYWYCDPSMLLLRRLQNGEWQCVACIFSGVKRQNHVDVFLEAGCRYYCVPFSCLASQQELYSDRATYPFRLMTYSSESVVIEPHSAADCKGYSEFSLVDAAVTSLLHKELLARDFKLVYPVAASGALACVHGEGSLYFLAINGACDDYLSLRLTVDLPDGLLIVLGRSEDSYDLPPNSQRLCLVVASNGKQSVATELNFRYMSSSVSVKRRPASANQSDHRRLVARQQLGSGIDLSLSGDLLTGNIDPGTIQTSGGGTIDTYLWIPQLGAF